MHKSKLTVAILTCLAASSTSVCQNASAQHETVADTVLPTYVVTAQRMETKELDTPADVDIITERQIRESGAANAFDAVRNLLGVTSQSQGFNGTSMGTMTSKIMIRGVEKGTLVLVNGVPINADGKYNLDDISTDMIQRIEVIRGGGSVMYGSDATGGVINIITKTKTKNNVQVGVGNYGARKYNLALSGEGLTFIGTFDKKGEASPLSGFSQTGKKDIYNYGGGERKSAMLTYDFNNGLSVTTRILNNENTYKIDDYSDMYKGKLRQINVYGSKTRDVLLRYHDKGWDVKASYDTQEKSYDKTVLSTKGDVKESGMSSWRKVKGLSFDAQKEVHWSKDSLIIGGAVTKESIRLQSPQTIERSMGKKKDNNKPKQPPKIIPPFASKYERTVSSLYASWNHPFSDKDTLILSGRQTWATGNKGEQKTVTTGEVKHTTNHSVHRFTPEIQYLHKVNGDESWYVRIGQSFRLPNLTQIYGTGFINPSLDLKPERGTNYEVGYKWNTNNAEYRATVFHYLLKDAIEAKTAYNDKGDLLDVTYSNQDQRNTGIELSANIRHNKRWSSSYGVMFQNPRTQSLKVYGDHGWHSIYNKVQLNGGVRYHGDRWTASLSANYLAERTAAEKSQRHIRPALFTDIDLQYTPNTNHRVQLHVGNVLNRRDITSNSTSNFYTLGRNYMLSYQYTF